MLKPVVFKGAEAGPRFLVLGAVHGNEKCGTAAINRVIAEIKADKLKIIRGAVTFVPICNPRAYERDVRFIERNLNRYLLPMAKPDCYEAELGNILCPLLEACDVLLDLHSYTVGGAPFFCVEHSTAEENEFALAVGPYALVGDWEDAYKVSGNYAANPNESSGTTSYARRHGATAALLECGQHKAPEAPEVAFHGILSGLRYLGMIAGNAEAARGARIISLQRVVYRTDDGAFAENWPNFAPVKEGQILAVRASGEVIKAPQDGVLVMPKLDCALGAEWFYFGVEMKKG